MIWFWPRLIWFGMRGWVAVFVSGYKPPPPALLLPSPPTHTTVPHMHRSRSVLAKIKSDLSYFSRGFQKLSQIQVKVLKMSPFENVVHLAKLVL